MDENGDWAMSQDLAHQTFDAIEDEGTYDYDIECDCGCGCGCIHQDAFVYETEAEIQDADTSLTIPYNKSFEEDDDSDFSLPSDPRFIDYGWAAECLHEPEDIDFDFVYALHTFVATVEGQANATKGDTMVLLDDSNSYWWLVRVVKDSSIGMLTFFSPFCSLRFPRFHQQLANISIRTRLLASRAH